MTNLSFGIAVKGIIKNNDGKILLVYKSETEDVNPNSFDIPGGRINWGEKLEDAVKREIKEEVDLDVTIERLSRSWGFVKGDLHLVGMTYIVKCENSDKIKLSDEHTGYFWRTKDEILDGDFPTWLKEEVRVI